MPTVAGVSLEKTFHMSEEELGAPEVEIEILGSTITNVPLDSSSGVNIITEKRAYESGVTTFKSCTKYLRMTDQ